MDKYQQKAVRIMEFLMFGAAILLVIVGKITGDTFFLRLATESLIFGGLALSVDLLLGIVGLLSLGQAMYFGFGAYLSALILRDWVPSFWICVIVVAVASAFLGWVTSYIALRSKGVYFALISFGLAQVFAKSVYNTRSLGASDGMVGVPIITIPLPFVTLNLGDAITFFVITFIFISGIYFLLKYFLYTPLGRIWGGVRSNESRLPYIGFNTQAPKRIAFILAAIVAGVSGALYPMLRGFVSPELMYFSVSGNAVITVVLGGVGTLIGPLFGSSLLMILKSVIGTLTVHHHIVIGLLFVVIVIFAPKGIVGILATKLKIRGIR
jgi:branched-chain amino acid transport system permease protein